MPAGTNTLAYYCVTLSSENITILSTNFINVRQLLLYYQWLTNINWSLSCLCKEAIQVELFIVSNTFVGSEMLDQAAKASR
jgi:hypothetical protein